MATMTEKLNQIVHKAEDMMGMEIGYMSAEILDVFTFDLLNM